MYTGQRLELDSLYRTAPVGLALLDPAGRYVRINELLAAINGIPAADHIGRSVHEVLPDIAAPVMAILAHVCETRQPLLDQSVHGTTPARPGIERVWSTSYHPVIAPDGSLSGVSVVVQDVTDRVRAEAAQVRAHARLQDVLDRMFVFVGVFSPDGVLHAINQAPLEATNLRREDLVGRAFADVPVWTYSPAVQQRLWSALQRAAAGEMVRYDDEFLIRPGHRMWLDVMLNPLHSSDGTITEIIASATDITERKQTSEALTAARERLRDLSRRLIDIQETERRSIARELHDEIGQALTATHINLQAIETFPDAATLAHRLHDSSAIIERALDQVRSLSLSLRPAMLDDLGLTAALRWLLGQQAARAGLQSNFVSNLATDRLPGTIETGCFRVAQEAINNIVKHASATAVTVELCLAADALHLYVRDDGRGFDPDVARTGASRGVSLGLLGMEERAALAGGTIEWTSARGAGTEVHASFPLTGAGAS
jgi:PAS domain S-box-containing protein